MGGIFSRPSPPPPPPPVVDESLSRREKAAEERERNEEGRSLLLDVKLVEVVKRLLMTAARFETMGQNQNAATQKTLGADRNPRDN